MGGRFVWGEIGFFFSKSIFECETELFFGVVSMFFFFCHTKTFYRENKCAPEPVEPLF